MSARPPPPPVPPASTAQRLSPSGALWASAFVLAGLVVLQASRLAPAAPSADVVSSAGEFTVLTADTGNDDMLVAIDNRREQLLVYKVVNQASMELYKRYSLPQVFTDARAKSLGRK